MRGKLPTPGAAVRALSAPEGFSRLEVEASRTFRDKDHIKHSSKILPRSEELEEGHSSFGRAFGHWLIRTPFQEKLKPYKGVFALEPGSFHKAYQPWDAKPRGQGLSGPKWK